MPMDICRVKIVGMYCIVGNFWELVESKIFTEKLLRKWSLILPCGENFYEYSQFAKVLSLKVFSLKKISPWKVSCYMLIDEWMKQAVFLSFFGRRKRLWNCLLQLVPLCGGMLERYNWHIWKQSFKLMPSLEPWPPTRPHEAIACVVR